MATFFGLFFFYNSGCFRIAVDSGVGLKNCSETQILGEPVAIAGSAVCLFTAAAAAEGCGGYRF